MRLSPYIWCSAALLLTLLLSVGLGQVNIPPLAILRCLFGLDPGPGAGLTAETMERIIFRIRLPETVLLALTGAALGGSGAAYQGLFRNPLADPYLIGIAPGAALGNVVAMILVWPATLYPVAALLGALVAVALVYTLARVGKSTPVTTLILSGVAVGAFANALIYFFMIERELALHRVVNFLLGGFGLGGWDPLWTALPCMTVGLLVLVTMGHQINVLQFGDEQASQMGLRVERVKLALVVAASLAAASAVAVKGIIGFVGLVVPHLVRLIWGPDYRHLVPLSILMGASVLLLADTTGRAVTALQQLPVGIITALVGAPFFLYLLRQARRSYW